MAQMLRRVPLDFNWPLNKVWEGFVNPHDKKCPEAAKGRCYRGMTNAGEWLLAVAHLLALIAEEAEQGRPEIRAHFTKGRIYPSLGLQRWVGAPRMESNPSTLVPLDDEMATLVIRLAGTASITDVPPGLLATLIRDRLLKAAGYKCKDNWGRCPVCRGDGLDPDPAIKKAYHSWRPKGPPRGRGYQLWETVSEGSPVSPVFATKDQFVRYLTGEGWSEADVVRLGKTG